MYEHTGIRGNIHTSTQTAREAWRNERVQGTKRRTAAVRETKNAGMPDPAYVALRITDCSDALVRAS